MVSSPSLVPILCLYGILFVKHLATLPCSLSPPPATGPSILWLPSLNNTSVTQDYHSYGRKNMAPRYKMIHLLHKNTTHMDEKICGSPL